MYKRIVFFLLLVCCAAGSASAQHTFVFNNGPVMARFQDSLLRISDATYEATNDTVRFEKNAQFIKTLVNSLKTHTSFYYPFDSLKRISVLKSPDNAFRIFTWYLPLDNGTYRYFGAIQMNTTDGKLKLFPLIDETSNIKDTNLPLSNKNWYGARYYEILPVVVSGRQPYYVLMGWKGNDAKTSKKVIEIFSFNKEEPVFGKQVFEGFKGALGKNRIIFEYNKLNSMTLTLNKATGMIVFDHLAPMNKEMEGNFEYYASDLSFDAYKVVNGKLKLVEDVELKNDPNEMDEFYVDPKDKNTKPIKKL